MQAALRDAFSRWGRPERFRVDNGTPWGSAGDWPTDLALWLIGLGIGMVWNPPRRPQDNGVIERSQGTGKRWGEPATCADARELQRRLDAINLFITTGFLPQRFRDEMRLPWDATKQRRFNRVMVTLGSVNNLMPRFVRQFPFNWMLKDLDWRTKTGRPLV